MAKRLMVLVGMMAVLLAVAVPAAFAQEEITATGTIRDLVRDCNECAHHSITDEASGAVYELLSDPAYPGGGVDLRDYVGERVTIHGTPQTMSTGRSDILFVTQVEPADSPSPSPSLGEETATLSFELTVKGTPPEGTRFFGAAVGEGGPGVPLTDPDGDGVFTGNVTVPRFPPGPRPAPSDAEPVSLSVKIVQENGGNLEVIRDFGEVPLDGDKTFKAKVSFKKDRTDTTIPDSDNGSSNNNGSSGSSGSGSSGSGNSYSGSGSGNSGNSGSSASGSSGNVSKGGATSSGSTGATKMLPNTGGAVLPITGVAGVLLVAGGLLIRRATR